MTRTSEGYEYIECMSVEAEGDVRYPLNRCKPPVVFNITDRSKAVLLTWFSVFAFLVSVSVSFLCAQKLLVDTFCMFSALCASTMIDSRHVDKTHVTL